MKLPNQVLPNHITKMKQETLRYDYVPPGMHDPKLLPLFDHAIEVDPATIRWEYLRAAVPHVFRSDLRNEKKYHIGYASYEEAVCLYNLAQQFFGRRGLEIGSYFGWTGAHLRAAGLRTDHVDIAFCDQARAAAVRTVLQRVSSDHEFTMTAYPSPECIEALAETDPEPWSFAFIDGNHDAPAPAEDARAVIPHMADDAVIVFHDLTSPDVAAGLEVVAREGWQITLFNTMQVLGVAWRGQVTLPSHIADTNVPDLTQQHLRPYLKMRQITVGTSRIRKESAMKGIWEDMVSLNANSDDYITPINAPGHYDGEELQPRLQIPYQKEIKKDVFPLPSAKGREGYYGDHHLNYWVSGLKDSRELLRVYNEQNHENPKTYMDFGGASGRVARHMLLQHNIEEVWIADINRQHINFVLEVFAGRIKAFQSTSLPHLPLEDNSLDLISAFSVFSHIETFDETWLLELRRVLKPGGIIIATANVDTFQDIKETWPVYKALANHPEFDKTRFGKPLRENRLVVRWKSGSSYSSIVYLNSEYVETRWKPFFSSLYVIPYMTQFQSGVVMRK